MEEKELYYKLEDNADMSCICQSLSEANAVIEGYVGDWDPNHVEELFFTITPVYMTESEVDLFGDSHH